LRSTFEQYDRASRVLMLVNRSFNFPSRGLPPGPPQPALRRDANQ